MNKQEKNGIRIALEEIKKLKRYTLCWEWMEESKKGEYIRLKEVEESLIKILQDN